MSSSVWSDSDLPEASESQPPARIELIDQTVVYGEITDIHGGELYVTTEWMGDVTIQLSSILYLESDQDIELLTTDQEKLVMVMAFRSLTAQTQNRQSLLPSRSYRRSSSGTTWPWGVARTLTSKSLACKRLAMMCMY